jgi:adenosylcobinamide kinase/adenosylcobinamide-phosphate guanylyltransferase
VKETIFVIGGCRSGKSGHALELALEMAGKAKLFMATCIPHDDEMKERVARHQAERSSSWQTLEVPVALPEAIREKSTVSDLILVDCLTLWISNLLMETDEMAQIEQHIQRLTLSLEAAQCPVILVSNEVGNGIVPDNRLARQFRDAVGFANQRVAACVDRVILLTAGIPMTLKG